jgi:hypothetical protein
MRNFILSALLIAPVFLIAQDYTMYQTLYITPNPGESQSLEREMLEHNNDYHADGVYAARAYSVTSGSHAGEYFWVMGPCTYSDLDDRPAGQHDVEWDSRVLNHGTVNTVEFWIMDEDLSYTPDASDTPRPLSRVRFFDVADGDLFRKTQGMIKATVEDMGGDAGRVMYRNQIMNREGRDWAIVSNYKNWAELDEDGSSFKESFEKLYGADAWDTFDEEFDKAVISREDEWRQIVD